MNLQSEVTRDAYILYLHLGDPWMNNDVRSCFVHFYRLDLASVFPDVVGHGVGNGAPVGIAMQLSHSCSKHY